MIQQRFGPGASNTLIYNRGSHIKFAQLTQAAPDTQIDAAAAFSKYYVEFNRASITPTSTLLRPRRIPTGVEQFKGSPGPFNVTASWTMDASAHRMELLFRQLLNAPTNGITTTDGSSGNTATAIRAAVALPAPWQEVELLDSGFTQLAQVLELIMLLDRRSSSGCSVTLTQANWSFSGKSSHCWNFR